MNDASGVMGETPRARGRAGGRVCFLTLAAPLTSSAASCPSLAGEWEGRRLRTDARWRCLFAEGRDQLFKWQVPIETRCHRWQADSACREHAFWNVLSDCPIWQQDGMAESRHRTRRLYSWFAYINPQNITTAEKGGFEEGGAD